MKKFNVFSHLVVILAWSSISLASVYSFEKISTNSPEEIEEGQLYMEVSDYGPNQALLLVNNTGPDDAIITGIYFEDSLAVFSGIAGLLQDEPGVHFTTDDAMPGNLPGGAVISFTANFGISSTGPTTAGIDPSEQLGIILNIAESRVFTDVIDSLNDRSARVGVYVRGLGPDGVYSDSFVNVPEPATLSLLALGGLLMRRRNQ